GPEVAQASLTHPAWSMLWTGPAEAGDTRFFVARGYVHVIGNPRGIGKSEGGGSRAFDGYDLIAWIAAQPWCYGHVGMVGISGFGPRQLQARKLNPAASQGHLSTRSARRLWRGWRLSRRISRRRHSPLSLPAAGLCLGASAERPAQAVAAGTGKVVAGGDRQSRLQDVPARLQCAGAQRPALPDFFRHSHRSLRQGGGGREKRV